MSIRWCWKSLGLSVAISVYRGWFCVYWPNSRAESDGRLRLARIMETCCNVLFLVYEIETFDWLQYLSEVLEETSLIL